MKTYSKLSSIAFAFSLLAITSFSLADDYQSGQPGQSAGVQPGQNMPDQRTSEQSMPDQRMSEQSMPDQRKSDQSMSEQDMSDQSVSDPGMSGQSMSEQSMTEEKQKMPDRAQLSSEEIKQAQSKLKEKGFRVGAIDGIVGKKTESSIRQFQKDNDQPVTGQLDHKTLSALGIETEGMAGMASQSEESMSQSGIETSSEESEVESEMEG